MTLTSTLPTLIPNESNGSEPLKYLILAEDVLKTARIDEAITDAKNMKFLYFAMTKIMGLPKSAEGLKECEDSMQALNDLRFKVIQLHSN